MSAFGRKFLVHRSILVRSPFFEAKLERWSDEDLLLPDTITEKAFAIVMHHLYSGSLTPMEKWSASAGEDADAGGSNELS